MTFNPHSNKTVNGVLITVGLKVLDYDFREGLVLSDDYDKEWQCKCSYHDRPVDPNAHIRANDLVADRTECASPCGHDHWFTVETANGTKSFNGSRLKAI